IWFLKSLPSRIGNILDITLKELEKVLYCEAYIVLDQKQTSLERGELLSEEKYHRLKDELGDDAFVANMGGEAVRELLKNIHAEDTKKYGEGLEGLANELREAMRETSSDAKRKKIAKRLKVVESFLQSDNKPEWMMLETV